VSNGKIAIAHGANPKKRRTAAPGIAIIQTSISGATMGGLRRPER